MQAFKRPLIPKRTDHSIKGFLSPEGMHEVGKTYRGRFGGPWFPCEPLKPVHVCDMCHRRFDPNTNTASGPDCNGSCYY